MVGTMEPISVADLVDYQRKNDHHGHDLGVELVLREAVEAEGACADAAQVCRVLVAVPKAAVEGSLCAQGLI